MNTARSEPTLQDRAEFKCSTCGWFAVTRTTEAYFDEALDKSSKSQKEWQEFVKAENERDPARPAFIRPF